MAQLVGDSFNQGKGPGAWGGGRNPYVKPKAAPRPVNDNLRPNASVMQKYRTPAPTRQAPVYRPPTVGPPSNYGKSSTGQIRPTSAGAYGSGAGGTAAAQTKAVQKAPAPPDINTYLKGDAAYITQQSALSRALADFTKQQGTAQTQYQGQYDLNNKDLGAQRTTGFGDLINDYASRGMLQSGLYGQAYSDLEREYNSRQTALDTARTNFLANLGTEKTNFTGEQRDATERAKQEAIARRAAKYGL